MRDPDAVKIDRPFAVFFEEAYDLPGQWVAHVVGHELDNVTQGDGPIGAARMLVDLLEALTDSCSKAETPGGDQTPLVLGAK